MDDRDALAAKDPDERRRRIVAAAVDVLVERGFAGSRMNDIAARAGTSAALIVYHFGTLDGVLAEAVHSVEDDFFDRFAAELPPGADAVRRLALTAALAADVDNIRNWRLWMEIWVRSLHDERTSTIRREMDRAFHEHVASTLRAGVSEGAFVCADVEGAATRLVGLLDGLAVQVALADPTVPADRLVHLWLCAAALETGTSVELFTRR